MKYIFQDKDAFYKPLLNILSRLYLRAVNCSFAEKILTMIFRTDIDFKKRWRSVLKVPIPFEVIPNESIFVHAADQFFISEAAEPATNWDGGGLSIL